MNDLVWLNGSLVPSGSALLPATDRGVLAGEGFFETMFAERRQVHLLRRHLGRLLASCGTAGIALDRQVATDAVRALLAERGEAALVVRLTVTAGTDGRPTVLVTSRPVPDPPEGPGIHLVVLASHHAGTGHKSTSFLPYTLAARELAARGADEGLLLTRDGVVAEGTISNVFVVEPGGRLVTPPLNLGIVAGIARGRIIELARAAGLDVVEAPLDPIALRRAREVFVTNAVRGVRQVARLEDRVFDVCPVATALQRAFAAERVNEEL